MSVLRVTKEFSFETAHVLDGYDGLCNQIHGHSYRLFITIKGEPEQQITSPKYGMIMDFSLLKKVVNDLVVDKYDHALVIRGTEHNKGAIEHLKLQFDRIIVTNYQPTCENMIVDIVELIRPELPPHVELYSAKLHETRSSFAEWFAEDNR